MKKEYVVWSVALLCCLAAVSFGDLNINDSSIINLYQLNEQTSGALTNSIPGSFVDSAVTGTPQNHDDAAWPGPPGHGARR